MAERRKTGLGKKAIILSVLLLCQVPAWAFFYYIVVGSAGAAAPSYHHSYLTPSEDDEEAAFPDAATPSPTVSPTEAPVTATPQPATEVATETAQPAPSAITVAEDTAATEVWRPLDNKVIGVSFLYPSYFRYGITESSSMEGIQISSYDLTMDYGGQVPVGLKLEIFRETNSEDVPLLEWAAMHEDNLTEDVTFQDASIGGAYGLMRYTQENDSAALIAFVPQDDNVYMILVCGSATELQAKRDVIDRILQTMSFGTT